MRSIRKQFNNLLSVLTLALTLAFSLLPSFSVQAKDINIYQIYLEDVVKPRPGYLPSYEYSIDSYPKGGLEALSCCWYDDDGHIF